MLIFFGFNPSTTAVAAAALLASYFVKRPQSNHAHNDKV